MVTFMKSKENSLLATMKTLYDSNQFTDVKLDVISKFEEYSLAKFYLDDTL